MTSRNSPCPCGSGKRAKHCCHKLGYNDPKLSIDAPKSDFSYAELGLFPPDYRGHAMALFCKDQPKGKAPCLPWEPPGLLVVEKFLPSKLCEKWERDFKAQPSEDATVNWFDPLTGDATKIIDPQRVTQSVPLDRIKTEVVRTVALAYKDAITPFFQAQLDTFSPPSVLKYLPGGKYDSHADSENWDPIKKGWIKTMDRDYSLLLYVNDGYEGGALYFPNFDIRIKPQRGMLVAFPSDHRYLHTAEPLISGERFVVVSWANDKRSRTQKSRSRSVWSK